MILDRFLHPPVIAGWTRHCLAFGLLVFAFGQSAPAQFLASELRSLSRAGGQTGTTFSLRATSGSNLEELDALIFSHPGISAELVTVDPLPFSDERRPDFGNFNVTIASDVPPGRYEVRVAGRNGVSNPRALLVTSLPWQLPSGVSHQFEAATEIVPGTIVQTKATPAEIDYFQLEASKGQSYRVDLLAHQIDSRLIGQVVLYDPTGRQVALARGADDVDPVLQFEADTEGSYRLAVHDFTFRGGDEYPYVLMVQQTDQAQLVPATSGSRHHWLTRALTVRDDFQLQTGSAVTGEDPQPIEVPASLSGVFPDDHRDTSFQFSATKDQLLALEVISHRLGEPTDARLLVHQIEPVESGEPKLHSVLNVDDSQSVSDGAISLTTKDPTGLLKIPATADYHLVVRDLDVGRTLRDQQHYQVQVREAQPGFDLVAYRMYPHRDMNTSQPVGTKLFRGGSEVIRVFAIRRDGWSGPIKVSINNLPEGVTATEAIIAANQTQTQIVITADTDAATSTQAIEVIGRSEDAAIEQAAVPATITWGKGAGRDYIQSRLAQQIMVAVSAEDESPLSITLGDDNVAEVKKGQAISLPVKLTRREGGNTNVVIRARDFPPGVSGKDVTIAADKTEGTFEVKTGNTPPGTYSLWLQAETKIKIKPNPQALQRAQAYRDSLQRLHDDPAQAENLDAIKAAIAQADKAVEAAKPLAQERELTVFLPTSNATLRVVEP